MLFSQLGSLLSFSTHRLDAGYRVPILALAGRHALDGVGRASLGDHGGMLAAQGLLDIGLKPS